MKHKKEMSSTISIRYKVFGYFAVFIACILLFLWFFQIVFLNDFYKITKINEIKSSAQMISRNIENEDLDDLLTTISKNQQMCMEMINISNGTIVKVDGAIKDCLIHKLPLSSLYNYYDLAKNNGGSYLEIINVENTFNNAFTLPWNKHGDSKSLIYAKIVTLNNADILLLLNTSISPVDATVNTLKIQLGCLSVLLVILAGVLAYIMYRKISRPIMQINEEAKKLAQGDYDTSFHCGGYKEIGELADTLNYASSELSKVEKLRQELIANISHDLRTPLTMIGGYAEAMRDLPGENNADNCQVIIDEVARLSTLVNDVLDISKLQSGNQVLNVEEFDLTQSIQNTLSRYSKFVSRDGYTIDFEYQEHVYVEADEIRISQVIYNLVNNALTYTGEDKVVLIKQYLVGDYVRVEVIDHGAGISKENLDYIWERYYKANNQHKRAVNGTGLGLSIVKNTLELHNQFYPNITRYGVESKEGEGSTFYFEYLISKK